jgi:hypothetical protein
MGVSYANSYHSCKKSDISQNSLKFGVTKIYCEGLIVVSEFYSFNIHQNPIT